MRRQPILAESMNATTSASSNSTTRALILWREIFPASAQRKIVRGQMPSRPAIDLALLNLRPPTALNSASRSINDFVVVCMATFLSRLSRSDNSARLPNLRYAAYPGKGTSIRPAFVDRTSSASISLVGFSKHLRTWFDVRRNTLRTSSFGKSFRHEPEIRRIINVAKTARSKVSHQKATPPGVAKKGGQVRSMRAELIAFFGALLNPTNSLGPCVYEKKGL